MRRFVLAAATAAAACMAVLAASPAWASTNIYSPEQAGYAVTVGNFRYIQDTFVLPDASKFAGNVGSFGLSVQLISADQFDVLGISTCTTTTCQTGGTAAHDPYNAAFAAFNPTTHALLTSNGASPAMSAGDVVTQTLYFNSATGSLAYSVTDATNGSSFGGSYHVGTGEKYGQARAGAEFACDPFDNLACSTPLVYDAPSSATALAALSVLRITNYAGHRGTLIDSHWSAHKIIMTRNGTSSGAVDVAPGGISGGRNFTVYLEP